MDERGFVDGGEWYMRYGGDGFEEMLKVFCGMVVVLGVVFGGDVEELCESWGVWWVGWGLFVSGIGDCVWVKW